MNDFDSYCTHKVIIKTLCKYRIKHAKKRHKYHLLRDISLHTRSLTFLTNKHICPTELSELFPSRRKWLRPNLEERRKFNNSQELNISALYKTVITTHIKVSKYEIEPPIWYVNLSSFIENIKIKIKDPENHYIRSPTIIPIRKDNVKECKVCRPISEYNLIDRIIIGLTAKYLTDAFDPLLHSCSYAFRSARLGEVKTHHDTISEILNYQNEKKTQNIWVAECDLKKFFDCVNQKLIINTFETFEAKIIALGGKIDENAKKIFLQYLTSYSFSKDVYPLNENRYCDEFGIEGGKFEWPYDELKSEFYGDSIDSEIIGIPQGGALSCLIANLILHDVDDYVDGIPKDSDLLFLRFCDDMVLLHTSKEKCEAGLQRYSKKVKEIKLLIHNPEVIEVYDKHFWRTKSKSPYKWSYDTADEVNVPWLAFVGYQIRYDGLIRVRKKSFLKETRKQKKEVGEVLNSLGHSPKNKEKINEVSRKSKRQQIFALESRLISMSVGRINLYNYKSAKPGLCWTNGFKKLTSNFVSKSQSKQLDRLRGYNLYRFKKELKNLTNESKNPDNKSKNFYFGHPFSYYNFVINNHRKSFPTSGNVVSSNQTTVEM